MGGAIKTQAGVPVSRALMPQDVARDARAGRATSAAGSVVQRARGVTGWQRPLSPPAPVEASPLPSHRVRDPQSSSQALHFQPGSSTPGNAEGQAQ